MKNLKTVALSALLVSGVALNPAHAQEVEQVQTDSQQVEKAEHQVSDELLRVDKIDYKTEIIYDDKLPIDTEIVVSEGKHGFKNTYKGKQFSVDSEGKRVEIPHIYSERVDPTPKVIRKGTNIEATVGAVSDKAKEIELQEKEAKALAEEQERLHQESLALEKEKEEQRLSESKEEGNSSGQVESGVEAVASLEGSSDTTTVESSEVKDTATENEVSVTKNEEEKSSSSPTYNGDIRSFVRSDLTAQEFKYADYIINRESGWNPRAQNPTSTAYGLGQLLYHDHYVAGANARYGIDTSDWRTNPVSQYYLMKFYVEGRYGTWEKAYNFWLSNHWY